MLGHVFPAIRNVAFAGGLAGRPHLLFICGRADCVFCFADSAHGGGCCSSIPVSVALDGNRVGAAFPDQFDDLFAHESRYGASFGFAARARPLHAGADICLAVWHISEDGCVASLDGRDRQASCDRSAASPI